MIPATCQFCHMAVQELGPLSMADVNLSGNSEVWDKVDLMAAVLSQGLLIFRIAIVGNRQAGRRSANLDFRAMGGGPAVSLLEDVGRVLRMADVTSQTPRPSFHKLSSVFIAYLASLMGILYHGFLYPQPLIRG